MSRFAAMSILVTLFVAPCSAGDPAKTTVREATPEEQERVEGLKSPIVMESEFPSPDVTARRKPIDVTDFDKYLCENVSLGLLRIRPGKPKDGFQDFDLLPRLDVLPGHDKLVTLDFKVVAGAEVIAETLVTSQADEGESRWVYGISALRLPVDRIQRGSPLTLRVTMSVKLD